MNQGGSPSSDFGSASPRSYGHLQFEQVQCGSITIVGNILVSTPRRQAGLREHKTLQKVRLRWMVFQNFNLFPHFSVLRNITMPDPCARAVQSPGA